MIDQTTSIVRTFIEHQEVKKEDLSGLIKDVYRTLSGLENPGGVSAEDTIHDEYLVCLEDGKHLKMLKRYLATQYDMTPEEYIKKWNLPSDYPMVAPAYSRKRSQIAKDQELGKT